MNIQEVRTNLMNRFCELEAEAGALEAVQINTKHKTLTNRAISGGRIGDYLNINKALYVSYAVTYPDTSVRYKSTDIPAYSYNDENGKEIGTNGIMRISRTITPKELRVLVDDIIASKRKHIAELEAEFKQVKELVSEREAIVKQIKAYNEKVSYTSGLKLKEA